MTYNPINIFVQDDLRALIKSRLVNTDIIIRGEQLKILSGVVKINGFLGVSDSSLESLGELKEITGDFWMSFHTVFSTLISLGKVEKIGGEVSLRYSNIIDLGALKEVGGTLNLRDTVIKNLGFLKYVGGDLYLPKRLKGKIDLSKVTVNGKIRYWNDSKTKKTILPKAELGLVSYPNGVPYWQNQYFFSTIDLKKANQEQERFYEIYKQKFKNGEFLDLEGNDNYSFRLYYDLLKENSQLENIHRLQVYFKNLEKYYPKTKNYTQPAVIEKMESHEDYKSAWKLKYKEQYIGVQTIIDYEQKLQRSLLDGELIVKLGGFSHLTEFGQNNIENIKPFASKQLKVFEKEKGMSFFELFFKNGKPYQISEKPPGSDRKSLFHFFRKTKQLSPNERYDAEYYKQFFLSEVEFKHYKSIDDSQGHLNSTSVLANVVEKAILNQCRLILKQAEDLYRESSGMPKIGEGWISETELYYKIANTFKDHEVIHHGSPTWLGRQHLDIYFPKLNIGIEYQGAQHYVAVDFFGGQEALEKTIERDKVKRKKCEENGCHLIIVDEGYDFGVVKGQIENLIENSTQDK